MGTEEVVRGMHEQDAPDQQDEVLPEGPVASGHTAIGAQTAVLPTIGTAERTSVNAPSSTRAYSMTPPESNRVSTTP